MTLAHTTPPDDLGPDDGQAPPLSDEEVELLAGNGNVRSIDTAPSVRNLPKSPPHDVDTEAAVLGAMLLSAAAADTATGILRPEHFYRPAHGHLFAAMDALTKAGTPLDAITVSEQLRSHGLLDAVGGPNAVIDLITAAPSTTNVATYAAKVAEHAARRHAYLLFTEIAAQFIDPTVELGQATGIAQGYLDAVTDQLDVTADVINVADGYQNLLDELERRQTTGALTGVTTGLTDLDHYLDGLCPGRLYTIAGRPAMGKTDVALHLATTARHHGVPTLIVSLEMGRTELLTRIVAHHTGVNHTTLQRADLTERDWVRLYESKEQVEQLGLYATERTDITPAAIRALARKAGIRPGHGLIVVDYLQLMVGDGKTENRQVEVANLSRAMKLLARGLDVPVVQLAQLNRGVEGRSEKRPGLADLRDSGAIEQDSDVVIALYRDEMYTDNSKDRGVMELLIVKNRHGEQGVVKVAYDPARKRIRNLDWGTHQ